MMVVRSHDWQARRAGRLIAARRLDLPSSAKADRVIASSAADPDRPTPRWAAAPRLDSTCRAAGFTLIEVLVVLIITALISGILLFAFQRVLDVRIRLAAFLDGTDAPTLIAGWFRGSIEGLVADQKGGRDIFAGTAQRLTGLSVEPVDGSPGVPTSIAWELVFDAGRGRTELRYKGSGRELTVASWPGKRGSLHYCGPTLRCFDAWPPPQEEAAELPALIVLEAIKGTEDWTIVAAPQSALDPLPKRPDFAHPPS
jgi:general secretion pathway protein J